jgi:hypothetical protein
VACEFIITVNQALWTFNTDMDGLGSLLNAGKVNRCSRTTRGYGADLTKQVLRGKGQALTAKKSDESGGGASKTSPSNPSISFSYIISPALLIKAAGKVALSFNRSSLLTVRDSPSDPTFSYIEINVAST